eukprot:4042909-Pyramimonas_sp.AAC.1
MTKDDKSFKAGVVFVTFVRLLRSHRGGLPAQGAMLESATFSRLWTEADWLREEVAKTKRELL